MASGPWSFVWENICRRFGSNFASLLPAASQGSTLCKNDAVVENGCEAGLRGASAGPPQGLHGASAGSGCVVAASGPRGPPHAQDRCMWVRKYFIAHPIFKGPDLEKKWQRFEKGMLE